MNKRVLNMAFLVFSAVNYGKTAVNNDMVGKYSLYKEKNNYEEAYVCLENDIKTKLTPVFENYYTKNSIPSSLENLEEQTAYALTILKIGLAKFTPEEIFNNKEKYNAFMEDICLDVLKKLNGVLILPPLYCYNLMDIDYQKPFSNQDMELLEYAAFNFNSFASNFNWYETNVYNKDKVFKTIDIFTVSQFFSTIKYCDENFDPQGYGSCKHMDKQLKIELLGYFFENLDDRFKDVHKKICEFLQFSRGQDITKMVFLDDNWDDNVVYNSLLINVFYIFCGDQRLEGKCKMLDVLDNNVYRHTVRLNGGIYRETYVNFLNNLIEYRCYKESFVNNSGLCLGDWDINFKIFKIFDPIVCKFFAKFMGVESNMVSIDFIDCPVNFSYFANKNKIKFLNNPGSIKPVITFLELLFNPNKHKDQPYYAEFFPQIRDAIKEIVVFINRRQKSYKKLLV